MSLAWDLLSGSTNLASMMDCQDLLTWLLWWLWVSVLCCWLIGVPCRVWKVEIRKTHGSSVSLWPSKLIRTLCPRVFQAFLEWFLGDSVITISGWELKHTGPGMRFWMSWKQGWMKQVTPPQHPYLSQGGWNQPGIHPQMDEWRECGPCTQWEFIHKRNMAWHGWNRKSLWSETKKKARLI